MRRRHCVQRQPVCQPADVPYRPLVTTRTLAASHPHPEESPGVQIPGLQRSPAQAEFNASSAFALVEPRSALEPDAFPALQLGMSSGLP